MLSCGQSLWLRVGDEARDLDQGSTAIHWERVRGHATLELLDDGLVIARVHDRRDAGGGAEDPTAFAEMEDWDFGLFVTNVLRDDGRRARIYLSAR